MLSTLVSAAVVEVVPSSGGIDGRGTNTEAMVKTKLRADIIAAQVVGARARTVSCLTRGPTGSDTRSRCIHIVVSSITAITTALTAGTGTASTVWTTVLQRVIAGCRWRAVCCIRWDLGRLACPSCPELIGRDCDDWLDEMQRAVRGGNQSSSSRLRRVLR
jgi:hypothetical protein